MAREREGVRRIDLQRQLQDAGQLSQMALDPSQFGGGRAGGIGAIAQIATAGIGAYAQNKIRKQLAEREVQEQRAFSGATGVSPGVAAQLGPEGRQALLAKQLGAQIESRFAQPEPLSPEGKKARDIQRGFLPEGTPLGKPEDIEKRKERFFKQTTKLRNEFTKASGEFVKSRDAFDRVQASAEDPSAAGDLSLIFNFMKVLDPGSTVREGEFANAQNSGSVPARIIAQYNKVLKGERLSSTQRGDFVNRSGKLFDKAKKSHERRINQYEGIARRNQLPVEDVIVDLIGDDPVKAEAVAEVATPTPTTAPDRPLTQMFSQDEIQAELKRRGLR